MTSPGRAFAKLIPLAIRGRQSFNAVVLAAFTECRKGSASRSGMLAHSRPRSALDVQQLLDDDLDAAVLRLTYTRTRWHQQMRVAEALDSDGACRHAVFDQFGLHCLGTAYR